MIKWAWRMAIGATLTAAAVPCARDPGATGSIPASPVAWARRPVWGLLGLFIALIAGSFGATLALLTAPHVLRRRVPAPFGTLHREFGARGTGVAQACLAGPRRAKRALVERDRTLRDGERVRSLSLLRPARVIVHAGHGEHCGAVCGHSALYVTTIEGPPPAQVRGNHHQRRRASLRVRGNSGAAGHGGHRGLSCSGPRTAHCRRATGRNGRSCRRAIGITPSEQRTERCFAVTQWAIAIGADSTQFEGPWVSEPEALLGVASRSAVASDVPRWAATGGFRGLAASARSRSRGGGVGEWPHRWRTERRWGHVRPHHLRPGTPEPWSRWRYGWASH